MRRSVAAVALAAVAALVGCGGSDASAPASPTTAPAPVGPTTTLGAAASAAQRCTVIRTAFQALDEDENDPVGSVDRAAAAVRQMVAALPPELYRDGQTVAAAYADFYSILRGVLLANGGNLVQAEIDPQVTKAFDVLDSDAVRPSIEAIKGYLDGQCGDVLGDSVPAS